MHGAPSSPSTRKEGSSSWPAGSVRAASNRLTAVPAQELGKEGVKVTGISGVTGSRRSSTAGQDPASQGHAGILAKRGLPAHEQALREGSHSRRRGGGQPLFLRGPRGQACPSRRPSNTSTSADPPSCARRPRTSSYVAVVVDPADTPSCSKLDRTGGPDAATRLYLAQKAFRHTARYEAAIAGYFRPGGGQGRFLRVAETKRCSRSAWPSPSRRCRTCATGRTAPRAAFYSDLGSPCTPSSPRASCRARSSRSQHPRPRRGLAPGHGSCRIPAASSSTHDPCGTRNRGQSRIGYTRAWECDPMSAFGGILAFNRRVLGRPPSGWPEVREA